MNTLTLQEARNRWETISGLLCPGQEDWLFAKANETPLNGRLLEIGSYRGRSTTAIGCACVGTKRQLTCIDCWTYEGWDDWGIILEPNETRPPSFLLWKQNMRRLGLQKYLHPEMGDSHKVLTDIRARHPSGPWVDFVFIDGSHFYDGISGDFKLSLPLLKVGAVVVFHDIIETWPDVVKVWEEEAKPLLRNIGNYGSLAWGYLK